MFAINQIQYSHHSNQHLIGIGIKLHLVWQEVFFKSLQIMQQSYEILYHDVYKVRPKHPFPISVEKDLILKL